MRKIKKFFIPVFLFVTFGLLVAISELIFMYKNRSGDLAVIYLYLAEKQIEKGKVESSLSYLNSAAYLHIRQNESIYPEFIQTTPIDNNLKNLKSETADKVNGLLKEKVMDVLKNNNKSKLSNVYYKIGLLIYEKNYHNEAIPFFSTAILLDPTLSFLHVELANVYFNDKDFEKGLQALEFCQKFEPAKKHCFNYVETNVRTNSFDAVGSLSEITDEYQIIQ
ncbi:MAG TPA: hypothetical protein VI819_04075 [Patescibacteria group bacterium]|nr:hypothetical protein [Patescibacteria group bacterium]